MLVNAPHGKHSHEFNHTIALTFSAEREELKLHSSKVQVRHRYKYQYFLNLEQYVQIRQTF